MYNVVFSIFLILNHPFKNSTLKYVKEMFDQTSAKSVLIKKNFFFSIQLEKRHLNLLIV